MRLASSLSTPRWRSMYCRIARLMCGKICGVASCKVLSKSNSQTGFFIGAPCAMKKPAAAGFLDVVGLVRLDHGADAVVGQDFQQQCVFDTAVDDMHALDPVAGGIECRADLRQHAARECAVLDH